MKRGSRERVFKIYSEHKNDSEPATYDALTGKKFAPKSGYQVSFVRPEAFRLLDGETWDRLTAHIMERTGSREYVGITPQWGGETSFHVKDEGRASEIAALFNQESILDWAALATGDEEPFVPNDEFDENEEVDYDAVIKAIL